MALSRRGKEALERMRIRDRSSQLELLDPTAEQGIVPWDGRSPRGLTRQALGIRLGHEGASLNEFDARIDEQCRRHLHGWS